MPCSFLKSTYRKVSTPRPTPIQTKPESNLPVWYRPGLSIFSLSGSLTVTERRFDQAKIHELARPFARRAIPAPHLILTALVVMARKSGAILKIAFLHCIVPYEIRLGKSQMSNDVHDIAAMVRLRLERSEAGLFDFLRSCDIEETNGGGNFFCRAEIDGAAVHLLTSNQSVRVIKFDRRAVQHIDVDSRLLFEACRHALNTSKSCDETGHGSESSGTVKRLKLPS